jgi:hypothetical protein
MEVSDPRIFSAWTATWPMTRRVTMVTAELVGGEGSVKLGLVAGQP